EPYTVYSPFARKWEALEKRAPFVAPAALSTPELPGVPIERVRAWRDLPEDPQAPRGGEREAARLLSRFLAGPIERYPSDRNRPDREGTSRLSPHLHFGTISPRTIASAAAAAGPSAGAASSKFLRELAWRDFYHHVLFHIPRVARESFRSELDSMEWREDPEAVSAWREGRTGYPLVDAGMRQVATTHWMHNRARMTVASFLTKDLHVHWREGVRWFDHELADADLANNNGGWQWAAGTGTDAAPFFRIFNPVLQSRKFDPEGTYIRRFVPELARVPPGKIHEPWTMTDAEQRESGCRIGRDYPAPIVDHAKERTVALEMFGKVRK
ncbi:MAG: DNA photolyase family protein, partial [Acidobacteriota bacterium]|nr:DNA photolyase family protein [Acidobacteriota bacterium]